MPVFAINGTDPAPNANGREFVDGNPECGGNPYFSFKVDAARQWRRTGSERRESQITNLTQNSFDWAMQGDALHLYDMAAVIVKAGSGANVYYYSDVTDDWDTGLESPSEDGRDQQSAISHLVFCFNQKMNDADPHADA